MNDKQSPKVCPVTGMFLEEPVTGQEYWLLVDGEPYCDCGGEYKEKGAFLLGNSFDSEANCIRWRDHLRAMAKLRRLGGVNEVHFIPAYTEIGITLDFEIYTHELTPEEQNALMWPNEDK